MRDKGHGIRDKYRKEMMKEKGKGTRDSEDFSLSRTKEELCLHWKMAVYEDEVG